jgi:tetrahydromethanopterin S-methyltransferase subunit G
MHLTVRESWTDERLDDFKERVEQRFDEVDRRFDVVDRRFDEVDARFDRLETRVEQGFARMEGRIDSLGRAVIYSSLTLSTAMIAGFIAVLTQV